MTPPEENVISSPERAEQKTGEQPEPGAATEPAPSGAANGAAASSPSTFPVPSVLRTGETLIQSLLSIIVIVLFVITFIVQAFQIPSESMEKTLLVGDYLLVDKIHFGQGGISSWLLPYRPLRRGDIVVFHYPLDPSQHYVKRVIGLPGDHIYLRNKLVYLNGSPLEESYAIHASGDHDLYRDNFPSELDQGIQTELAWRSTLQSYLEKGQIVVPQGQYFVMGDNRDRSADSRYWGFVPRDNVVGRPLIIYLSVRNQADSDSEGASDKLPNQGYFPARLWQFARWNRILHRVR